MILIILLVCVNLYLLTKVISKRKEFLRISKRNLYLINKIKELKEYNAYYSKKLKAIEGRVDLANCQLKHLKEIKDRNVTQAEANYHYLASICAKWNYNLIRIPKLLYCLGDLKDEVFFKEVKHCV